MLFVRQSSKVAAPTVYDDKKPRCNFIVQERIRDRCIRECYNDLSKDEKEGVWTQLRANLDGLRAIKSPGYFGGVWDQPCRDGFLTGSVLHLFDPVPGPIRTEKEWVQAMVETGNKVNKLSPEYGRFIPKAYEATFQGHESFFTHGDLHPDNVFVREDDKSVVLIDWEMSGWAPSF